MVMNPRRVRLDSELADLDQQLSAFESSPHLSSGQRVVRKSYLQHQRHKKFVEVEILKQEELVESRKRGVESARKRYEWARTADGLKVLLQREQRRQAGMALGSGGHTNYTALDRLQPEERVIKIAEGLVRSAESRLHEEQARLAETTRQLRELQAKDSEWETLASASTSVPIATPTSAERLQKDDLVRGLPFEKSVEATSLQVANWDMIEISFLSDERVQLRNRANNETHNYAELGFADQRNGKPNSAWLTLCDLAQGRGIIKSPTKTATTWPKVEKRMQEIRKVLRRHFGIATDPVPFVAGTGYQARFKIGCGPSFHT